MVVMVMVVFEKLENVSYDPSSVFMRSTHTILPLLIHAAIPCTSFLPQFLPQFSLQNSHIKAPSHRGSHRGSHRCLLDLSSSSSEDDFADMLKSLERCYELKSSKDVQSDEEVVEPDLSALERSIAKSEVTQ